MTTARYDGFADWYDERIAPSAPLNSRILDRLLGRGTGSCLDLCCGSGLYIDTLQALGWDVTGVDISADQLRVARRRAGEDVELVRCDATALPFPDGRFDAVVSLFSHTDVDDFAGVVGEGARVLRPGGVLVYAGIHPCFEGPHSKRGPDDSIPTLHPGYRATGRLREGPGIAPDGLWAKVGGVHLTLARLVQAFLDGPLALERVEEDGQDGYPRRLTLRARRT